MREVGEEEEEEKNLHGKERDVEGRRERVKERPLGLSYPFPFVLY
jgi:hypothetical protein